MEFVVPSECRVAWHALGAVARAHVQSFVQPNASLQWTCGRVASEYAADVTVGAPQLGLAFPTLRRTVTRITPLAIEVACTGVHVGLWYGLVLPTQIEVSFDELHHVDQTRDVVDLDFAAIVRQLCRGSHHDEMVRARVHHPARARRS